MRNTIVPAQITTVEDKIAGNLTITQLLLFMTPVFLSIAVYMFLTPTFQLSFYKLPIIVIATFIFFILAIRIKEKLILDWLILIVRFNLRPKFYIFNKNNIFLRTMDIPHIENKTLISVIKDEAQKQKSNLNVSHGLEEFVKLEYLLQTQSLSFKIAKKGGFNVSME